LISCWFVFAQLWAPFIKELVNLFLRDVEAERRHCLLKLFARHFAVAVRIPCEETVTMRDSGTRSFKVSAP